MRTKNEPQASLRTRKLSNGKRTPLRVDIARVDFLAVVLVCFESHLEPFTSPSQNQFKRKLQTSIRDYLTDKGYLDREDDAQQWPAEKSRELEGFTPPPPAPELEVLKRKRIPVDPFAGVRR